MDFQTLPYLYVTISFLLEICFWGPTHPTFSDDVTLFTVFFLKASLREKNFESHFAEKDPCMPRLNQLGYKGAFSHQTPHMEIFTFDIQYTCKTEYHQKSCFVLAVCCW